MMFRSSDTWLRPFSTARAIPRGAALSLALLLPLGACKDNPVDPDPASVTCQNGSVVADGRTIPAAPNGFATVGNRIIEVGTCKDYRFLGVSRPTLSFTPTGGRLGVDTAAAADFARIRGWKANTVRIELAQYFSTPGSRFFDAGYDARVDRAVKQARAAGLNVILALQHSDRGDPNYPGDYRFTNMHQPMPDVNHSVPFWRKLAERYKNDGGILFEIYSEPYPGNSSNRFSNWDLWLNGGTAAADNVYEPRGPFQAVGMQQLYDVVRSTGANNLVLVGGTAWGYYLDGVRTHPVKGHNIVYTTHLWDFESKQPELWDKDWAFLAATQPVMISEFGNYNCTTRYVNAALDAADRLKLSWVAWAWEAPAPGASTAQTGEGDPICSFPMLITDWSGTPSRTGQLIKDRLGRS